MSHPRPNLLEINHLSFGHFGQFFSHDWPKLFLMPFCLIFTYLT